MPYSTAARNTMLDALTVSHVGLLSKGADITGVTSTGSPDTFSKTAHGLSNGDMVVFSAVSGGSGLRAGDLYFVVNSAANTFQVATTSGGSAVDLASDVTSATVNKVTELSGGSPAYARGAISLASAANSLRDDTTNGVTLNVPASSNVDYIGGFSASTAGTLQAFTAITRETYAGQGTFNVNDAKLDLLA